MDDVRLVIKKGTKKVLLGFVTTSFILLVMIAPTTTTATTASLQQQEDNDNETETSAAVVNATTADEPNIPIEPPTEEDSKDQFKQYSNDVVHLTTWCNNKNIRAGAAPEPHPSSQQPNATVSTNLPNELKKN